VLGETRHAWARGAGTCVGCKFPGIEWKVIAIDDRPLANLSDAVELPRGQIGELIVAGAVVTRRYVTRTEWNALAKISDPPRTWHRMGDVGYLDDRGRFWFCGRMTQRVRAADGVLFTIRCEAVFNQHADVYRSALVGVGPAANQRPVVVVEPWPERRPRGIVARQKLIAQLGELARANPVTRGIHDFLIHPAMPVDVRHNAKISREKLAAWAAGKLR
jgi:acyl-CoA synthetase (AMP-forming)/AMP-acid ligase II